MLAVLLLAAVVLLSGCITKFSPLGGQTAGGNTVTITGSHFLGATAVRFGTTTAARFSVTSTTTITAVTKAHAPGRVSISVIRSTGVVYTSSAGNFTFEVPPTLSGLSPASGTGNGGAAVVLTGTHLTDITAVTFGSTTAVRFTLTSPTKITALTPAHAVGKVSVQVTNYGGTARAPSDYTYTPPAAVIQTYSCITPLNGGVRVISTIINDQNTAPASVSEGTSYVAKPKVTVFVPAFFIRSVSQVTSGVRTVEVSEATLTIVAKNFTPATQVDAPTNLPIEIPKNTTTEAHGAVITVTYAPTRWTASAASGKATLTPGNLALRIRGINLPCYPPGIVLTPHTTTPTLTTVSGTSTEVPIDTLTV